MCISLLSRYNSGGQNPQPELLEQNSQEGSYYVSRCDWQLTAGFNVAWQLRGCSFFRARCITFSLLSSRPFSHTLSLSPRFCSLSHAFFSRALVSFLFPFSPPFLFSLSLFPLLSFPLTRSHSLSLLLSISFLLSRSLARSRALLSNLSLVRSLSSIVRSFSVLFARSPARVRSN